MGDKTTEKKTANSKSMEKVVCSICETDKYEERHYPINSGVFVKCKKCGLYYANPRRTESINKVKSNQTCSKLYDGKKVNLKGRKIQFNYYLEKIKKFKKQPGNILDIGCYEGLFLYAAKKRGWNVKGVEPNIGAAKFAKDELKLDVKQCLLKDAKFDDNLFDVVTLFACLEHVPNPSDILNQVRNIIKDDGLLILTVPVIPFYLPLIKSRWRMFIGDHYYFFTDVSMRKLLQKNDFEIIHKEFTKKNFDLDTLSYRLSSSWQPYKIGNIGNIIRKYVLKLNISDFRFEIKPRDTKIYVCKPV